MADTPANSLETPQDAGKGPAGEVRLWLAAIKLQDEQEEDWRKAAADVIDRFRMEEKGKPSKRNGFPILYANTSTILPAIYNSPPLPDVRRRFNDADPTAKDAAQVLERAISHCCDEYDFHAVLTDVVQDMGLPGRGVARVRYEPLLDKAEQSVVYHKVYAEHVQWADFRIGPGKRWGNVPWIAFRHTLTRKQLVGLNKELGPRVPLNVAVRGKEEDAKRKDVPDIFMRAEVWEIWDKDAGKVRWLGTSWPNEILRTDDDPLKLEGFWPMPRPLYAISTTDSLCPIEPFRVYRSQADELDDVTRRIRALIKVCRARGIYDSSLAAAFKKLETSDDGVYVPTGADEASKMETAKFTMEAGLDKAIWSWPLETVVNVLKELYVNREQIIGTIRELTGIADIMRGQTDPRETKGAQDLKTQWGTLRIMPAQAEVQRYARDLIRLKAEIIAEKFDPRTLSMITGIDCVSPPKDEQGQPQIDPQTGQPVENPIPKLLKTEQLRSYRIDIETDSTIRGDVAKSQEQISRFVEGTGAYFTSIGPAVQEGAMPKDVAIDLFAGFARTFKLGKSAEDALDRWSSQAQQEAQNPQPAPQDPAVAEAQAKIALEQQKMQMEGDAKAAEMQMKQQEAAAKMQLEQQKLELEHQREVARMQMEAERGAMEMGMQREQAERDHAVKQQDLQLREREGQTKAQLEAAKIVDGQDARTQDAELRKEEMDVNATGIPKGAMKDAAAQIAAIMKSVEALAKQVGETHEMAMAPAEVVRGPDGKVAGIKRGNVVKMVQRGADGRVTGV